ncbi:MAG: hypothetical protein Q8L23_03625 [Caulobacter sp.]|nr:hypothetical protein [Caulobacter sp.]
MGEMISFRVVKEPYGWAVRVGQGMMTPFRSRVTAINHANGFAETLRRHGETAEVVLEEIWPMQPQPCERDRPRFRPLLMRARAGAGSRDME